MDGVAFDVFSLFRLKREYDLVRRYTIGVDNAETEPEHLIDIEVYRVIKTARSGLETEDTVEADDLPDDALWGEYASEVGFADLPSTDPAEDLLRLEEDS